MGKGRRSPDKTPVPFDHKSIIHGPIGVNFRHPGISPEGEIVTPVTREQSAFGVGGDGMCFVIRAIPKGGIERTVTFDAGKPTGGVAIKFPKPAIDVDLTILSLRHQLHRAIGSRARIERWIQRARR